MLKRQEKEKHTFSAIDGLRTYSAIGIVLLHVKDNTSYNINGFVYNRLISSFADLVFLFMVISGFTMCCGYYDQIIDKKLSISEFYSRRYMKI